MLFPPLNDSFLPLLIAFCALLFFREQLLKKQDTNLKKLKGGKERAELKAKDQASKLADLKKSAKTLKKSNSALKGASKSKDAQVTDLQDKIEKAQGRINTLEGRTGKFGPSALYDKRREFGFSKLSINKNTEGGSGAGKKADITKARYDRFIALNCGGKEDNADKFIIQLARENGAALEAMQLEGEQSKLRSLQTQIGAYMKSAVYLQECAFNVSGGFHNPTPNPYPKQPPSCPPLQSGSGRKFPSREMCNGVRRYMWDMSIQYSKSKNKFMEHFARRYIGGLKMMGPPSHGAMQVLFLPLGFHSSDTPPPLRRMPRKSCCCSTDASW